MNDLIPASGPAPGHNGIDSIEEAAGTPTKYRVQKLLEALRRCWWVPALTTLLGVGAGAAFVVLTPPTFVSTARMWETLKLRLPEGVMFSEDAQNFVGTQTELLKSATLRQQALASLKSSSSPVYVPLGKDGQPVHVPIQVSGGIKSSVLTLEATGSNPAYVQAYLQALMNVYLDYKRNVRKVVSGDTLASISEQVQRTERDLKAEQDILMAFQRTNNLAILQQEATVSGGYLTTLKTKLSDLQLETRLLQAAATDRAPSAGGTNASMDLVENAVVSGGAHSAAAQERQSAFKELELLKIQRDRLSKNLRPKHPKIVKLDTDIQRAEKLIDIFRRQNRDQLAAALQANQLRIDNVVASIREWESRVLEANTRIAEAERLRLNVQRVQTVYDRLVLLLQNIGISRNIDQETLAVLEPASEPVRSYLWEVSVAGLAAFGGIALGLGIVLLVAVRDDRFTSAVEVDQEIGGLVGFVPDVPKIKGRAPLVLLEKNDDRHMYAESFRSLRSALLFLTVEGPQPKVLLITSAVPGEGKSTIVTNLARTLAMGGSHVLLVDGDLRKGRLHDLLGMRLGPGFGQLLHQNGRPQNAIQSDSISNLSFISRGDTVEHPGDLFLRPELGQILDQWRKEFDYILIDSSPVFAADDACTLAPRVDGILFVVRDSFSRASTVREALELLARRQGKVLGLVFNRADASAQSYHYYTYADYYSRPKAREHVTPK